MYELKRCRRPGLPAALERRSATAVERAGEAVAFVRTSWRSSPTTARRGHPPAGVTDQLADEPAGVLGAAGGSGSARRVRSPLLRGNHRGALCQSPPAPRRCGARRRVRVAHRAMDCYERAQALRRPATTTRSCDGTPAWAAEGHQNLRPAEQTGTTVPGMTASGPDRVTGRASRHRADTSRRLAGCRTSAASSNATPQSRGQHRVEACGPVEPKRHRPSSA